MYTVSLRERALALARTEGERQEQERLRVERDLEVRRTSEAVKLFGTLADGAELEIRAVWEGWEGSKRRMFSHLQVQVGDLEFQVGRNGLVSVKVGNCQRCGRAVFRPVRVSLLSRLRSGTGHAEDLLTEVGRVLLQHGDSWGCEQCVFLNVYASPADAVGGHGENQ
jgi:ribosomal protein S27AE